MHFHFSVSRQILAIKSSNNFTLITMLKPPSCSPKCRKKLDILDFKQCALCIRHLSTGLDHSIEKPSSDIPSDLAAELNSWQCIFWIRLCKMTSSDKVNLCQCEKTLNYTVQQHIDRPCCLGSDSFCMAFVNSSVSMEETSPLTTQGRKLALFIVQKHTNCSYTQGNFEVLFQQDQCTQWQVIFL